MTIEGELSERAMFSGSIIDKPVYSILKTTTIITCMWELMLNLYTCTVLYSDCLFIGVLFMSWII